MKRYVISYLPQFFLGLAVFMLFACQNEEEGDRALADVVKVGESVPDFILTGDGGETLSSSSLKDQVYVLSFFDTGCPDCREELPVLQKIYDKYKDVVTVLNVPRSQTTEEARNYWGQNGLSMPVYAPQDKKLYYKFANSIIPRIYVVKDGIVQAVFTDSPLPDYDTLDTILQDQLGDDFLTDKNSVELSFKLNVMSDIRGSGDSFQSEYTISHLELFFFDASTKKYVTKIVVDNPTPDDDPYSDKYDITYVVRSAKLKVGVYNIFAIANYEYIPDNINEQDDLLNLTDMVSFKDGVEPNLPYTGPVMTNRATSHLSVNFVPWAGKKYVLQFDLERVMAKLQIGVNQNNFELKHEGEKYADINITNYKLVNLNKQYYLFQHKGNMTTLGAKPTFVLPDNYGEYGGGKDEYIIDPLFYEKTSSMSAVRSFEGYYESWYGSFTTDNFASVPTAGNFGYAYVLENTSFKNSQLNGYSPGIVFKAAVSPVFVYLYNSTTRRLVKEEHAEYWPNTLYLYNFNFYGSLEALNYDSGLSLDDQVNYSDAQLKVYGIKKCNFNMGVYETYYTYWIEHRQTSPMEAMNYAVVRNNFYKLVVYDVTGVGNSEIVPDLLRENYPNSYTDIAVSHY